MPNYKYQLINENTKEIIDEIWEIRSIADRFDPIVTDKGIYVYARTYPQAETIFKGGDWTSNSRIKYMPKHELTKWKEKEAKRKDFIQKWKDEHD